MRFKSKDISISDSEFGVTITFSEKEDIGYKPGDKIIDIPHAYILFQKTYPEDDDEYTHVEFSDYKKSGELKDYKIDLYKNMLILFYKKEKFEILFDVDEKKFQKIKKTMMQIVNQKRKLIVHEDLEKSNE